MNYNKFEQLILHTGLFHKNVWKLEYLEKIYLCCFRNFSLNIFLRVIIIFVERSVFIQYYVIFLTVIF